MTAITEDQELAAKDSGDELSQPATRQDLRRKSVRMGVGQIAGLAFFLGVWELIVLINDIPVYIVPSPRAIAAALWAQMFSPAFWGNFRTTAIEIGLGFSIGVTVATGLGVLLSYFSAMRRLLMPYIFALQTVPKIAIAPLMVVWFGFGIASKVLIAALVAFFPMLINVLEGLASPNREAIEMLRGMGANWRQEYRFVRIPAALPFVFAGLDLAIVFATIGAIVGEFVGAKSGLGYQLLQHNFRFDIPGVFSILIVFSIIGTGSHLLIRGAQKKLVPWSTQHDAASP